MPLSRYTGGLGGLKDLSTQQQSAGTVLERVKSIS